MPGKLMKICHEFERNQGLDALEIHNREVMKEFHAALIHLFELRKEAGLNPYDDRLRYRALSAEITIGAIWNNSPEAA
jgi:hypothetical protein